MSQNNLSRYVVGCYSRNLTFKNGDTATMRRLISGVMLDSDGYHGITNVKEFKCTESVLNEIVDLLGSEPINCEFLFDEYSRVVKLIY